MKTVTAPPYDRHQWRAIDALGRFVDRRLEALGVRMTMGGEPTFVAAESGDLPEWRTEALGTEKREKAAELMPRLMRRFPSGGVTMNGVGKWCPGEGAPRWALAYIWRRDGVSIWRRRELLAPPSASGMTDKDSVAAFVVTLAKNLGLAPGSLIPVANAGDWVLPLLRVAGDRERGWASCRWDLDAEALEPYPGDTPLGLRLPLDRLPQVPEILRPLEYCWDAAEPSPKAREAETNAIRVALCAELRDGVLHLFLPPVIAARTFLSLLDAIETSAVRHGMPLRIEGYLPPPSPLLSSCQAVPDPGVLEVNLPPLKTWRDLSAVVSGVYQEALRCKLRPWKEDLDGRMVESGGGCHVTIGGAECLESPFLRRPDLLTSFITYWQHHPGLSYAFTGLFAGPCSQTPRIDETRTDALYELEIALRQLAEHASRPLAVDRHLRHLLTDLTGNAHRAEFCIDKLYPEHDSANRLGLLELRSVAMPPHPEMALVLCLLLRTLVCRFWAKPYRGALVRWGSALHDRFALPYFIAADLAEVASDLQRSGYRFRAEWLQPFIDFRFPSCGSISSDAFDLELRQALEPWPILGQEMASGACSRSVDASVDRLQVRLRLKEGRAPGLLCNGYPVPLVAAGEPGDHIGGVRFTARHQTESLHPSLTPVTGLVFEVYDTVRDQLIGACRFDTSRCTLSPVESTGFISTRSERPPQPPVKTKPPETIVPRGLEPSMTLDLRRPNF